MLYKETKHIGVESTSQRKEADSLHWNFLPPSFGALTDDYAKFVGPEAV